MVSILGMGLPYKLELSVVNFAQEYKYEYVRFPSHYEVKHLDREKQYAIALVVVSSSNKQAWPLLHALSDMYSPPHVIALVEPNDAEAVEFAIQAGVWDVIFLQNFADLKVTINRCIFHREASQKQMVAQTIWRTGIVGTSSRLERCLQQLWVAARSDASLLILGETGTGKELFSRAAHENSQRAGKPYIVIDCTNLPGTLVESILFGYEKGAFTGANTAREGLFKQAEGGTIFLDEIGDLDLETQKSFLRVLQEGKFRPLGAKREVSCNFRIIAATNKDLEEMIEQGKFRQDLFHRIKTKAITLPPLRERVDDIPFLVEHYAAMFCTEVGCPPKQIAIDALKILKSYAWPGNIRELINVMHNTVLNSIAEQRIYPQHLPKTLRLSMFLSPEGTCSGHSLDVDESADQFAQSPLAGRAQELLGDGVPVDMSYLSHDHRNTIALPLNAASAAPFPSLADVRRDVVHELEEKYLRELKIACKGKFTQAQKISGLSRTRLYELLSKHKMSI